jgi:chromosome segregation ATPase
MSSLTRGTIREANQLNARLTGELEASKKQLTTSLMDLEKARREVEAAKMVEASLSRELEVSRSQIKELEGAVRECKARHALNVSQLESRGQSFSAKINAEHQTNTLLLQQDKESSQAAKVAALEALAVSKLEVTEACALLETQNQELAMLQTKVNKQSDGTAAHREISRLRMALEAAEGRAKEAKKRANELERQMSGMRAAEDMSLADERAQAKKIKQLEVEAKGARATHDSLEKAREELRYLRNLNNGEEKRHHAEESSSVAGSPRDVARSPNLGSLTSFKKGAGSPRSPVRLPKAALQAGHILHEIGRPGEPSHRRASAKGPRKGSSHRSSSSRSLALGEQGERIESRIMERAAKLGF